MDEFHVFRTHRVVFGGLEQYPEQPIDPGAAAQCRDGLIQVLLSLQGQQQLNGHENVQLVTGFHNNAVTLKVASLLSE